MAGLELSPHLSACSTPHTCHRLPGAHLTEWPLAGTERCLGHGQGRNGMGREAHGAEGKENWGRLQASYTPGSKAGSAAAGPGGLGKAPTLPGPWCPPLEHGEDGKRQFTARSQPSANV